jgi:hypothetical protein
VLLLLGASTGARASAEYDAAIPYSIPLEDRRRAAGTCAGFNLELRNAAGIKLRIGAIAEAERLLAQQRDCRQAPAEVRSAAPVGFRESRLRNLPSRR